MTAAQVGEVAYALESMVREGDLEFVGAEVHPTTVDELTHAWRMTYYSHAEPADEYATAGMVTLASTWTDADEAHDMVLIVADDGECVASFEIQ